ncbi:phage head-tail adapter protein [Methylibium sp. Pch-M]|uniref:portal protein n=1 Tax=Methylibium sp. Pch-M TaxID=2082386 RepID=UPI0010129BF6|nr:portal protein [Methylibium sp. Pch-M]QAZ38439.1 phage head-tail adapter protein [Methylibium sp. Pch-M]
MDIEALLRRFDRAKSLRSNWEGIWQEIGDRVLPQSADFNAIRTNGDRRTELMFDATPALALQKFGAAIESFLTPRNQRWHGLTVSDKSLQKNHRVRQYLDDVTETLFRVRYSARAAFAGQTNEVYLSLGAFGTGGLFIDDDVQSRVIRYKSMHLAGTHFLENQHGRIDTVFRCFNRTLRQIQQRWPDKLPQKLAERLKTHPEEQVEVMHYVGPRTDYEPRRIGYPGMPWQSCYCIPSEKHELEEGGFRSWPFAVSRYMTSANEVYGRSPAWLALSNIKVLNEMKKTHLKAGHRVVDPPFLVSEDGVLQAFSTAPGYMNYGGLTSSGEPLVKPLVTGGKVELGLDMMEREREIINDSFLVTLFQILVETPSMTATEVMERAQEKAALLAPVIGRQQSEFLGSIIDREIDILANAGQLPEMPPELIEAQGEYAIEYTSPMTRAMRASDGVAIVRTVEALLPIAQVNPGVLDVLDMEAAARELCDINGVPTNVVRSPEDVQALKEGRAEQEQAAAALQAAPVVTAAAANLVKLQANSGVPAL